MLQEVKERYKIPDNIHERMISELPNIIAFKQIWYDARYKTVCMITQGVHGTDIEELKRLDYEVERISPTYFGWYEDVKVPRLAVELEVRPY